jgi:large subunit ribosomal protein L18
MATNQVYTVAYRRKRDGKTDYKKRMKLLLGNKARLVVRKSNKNIRVQIITFQPNGDKILATASSADLVKLGWKGHTANTSAAYLVGMILAKKAKGTTCVLDIGQYTSVKASVLYALAKGAKDGGLDVACSDEIVPDQKRLRGEHIAAYAKTIKSDKARFEKQFSKYLKSGLDPEKLPEHFDQIKSKIGAK